MASVSVLHYVCLILFLACSADVEAARVVFNVMNGGAVADGKTDNSKVFENVFNQACQSSGRNVILIPGGTYMLRPVVFKGPCKGRVVFHVVGTLIAPSDMESSATDHWITFQYLDQLRIGGGGSLDGQGPSAWGQNTCSRSSSCKPLPASLKLDFVTNSRISKLTSINSKGVHMNIFACKGLELDQIYIKAPADSPNTDGIHIGSSSHINISDSMIATGDDCISMSPGSTNITMTNIQCGPGHGISVGSLGAQPDEEDVGVLTVRNCTFTGTQNGVRIKTWARPYASNVFDLTFENINMVNVNNPIIIDQQYCPGGNCQKGDSQVQIRDVTYRNIWGISSSKVAVALDCSQSKPCQQIQLSDINLLYHGPGGPAASTCFNAKGVADGRQQPPSCV